MCLTLRAVPSCPCSSLCQNRVLVQPVVDPLYNLRLSHTFYLILPVLSFLWRNLHCFCEGNIGDILQSACIGHHYGFWLVLIWSPITAKPLCYIPTTHLLIRRARHWTGHAVSHSLPVGKVSLSRSRVSSMWWKIVIFMIDFGSPAFNKLDYLVKGKWSMPRKLCDFPHISFVGQP